MHQKSWWYDLSFLTYGVWQTEIGNYGSFFALLLNLPPPTSYKNQKMLGMHGSWDTEWGRQNFLSFWAMLCCFTSLTTQKIKILKKRKSIWICHHFTHVYQKSQCMLPELWSVINIICYHFEPFFALLPHYWPQKTIFGKKCFKNLEILSFYFCVTEIKIIWCQGISQKWKTSSV